MIKTVGVLDILGKCSYSEYVLSDDRSLEPELLFSTPVPTILIIPENLNSSRGPYLISREMLIPDDIIQGSTISYSSVYPVTKMMLSMQINVKSNIASYFFVDKEKCDNPKSQMENLSKYFSELRRYIGFKRPEGYSLESLIMIIPDWLDDASQDHLLSVLRGSFPSPVLLWTSIAACLGAMGCIDFSSLGLGDGSRLTVRDCSSVSSTTIRLELKIHGNRFLPCHRIFWNSDGSRSVRKEYYPDYNLSNSYDVFSNQFEVYSFDNGFMGAKAKASEDGRAIIRSAPQSFPELLVGIKNDTIILRDRKIEGVNLIFKGAKEYIRCKRMGLPPYLEECCGLYMVVITTDEEVQLKPLIDYNAYVPAGQVTNQEMIDDINLQKGSDAVVFNLLFTTEASESLR
ncbi:MAG: hypothetical protein SPJ34_08385 [Candidatus Ornithospirochaeta sp.]|nr:hypothetical protein [Candidatus Ornithospirochaeta sp.]